MLRAGRGRGRGRYGRNNNNNDRKGRGGMNRENEVRYQKPQELKFAPHGGTNTQSMNASYNTVRDEIIMVIQQTYSYGHDMATSIADGKMVNIMSYAPERLVAEGTITEQIHYDDAISTIPDDESDAQLEQRVHDAKERLALAKQQQQKGYDILYEAEIRKFLDRKEALEHNAMKAFALIYHTYCTRSMQNRLEERDNYEREIKNDPLLLLDTIKILIHDPARAKYPYASATEALKRMLNTHQLNEEPLNAYIKRFKEQKDIVKSHMGSKIMEDFATRTPEYKQALTDVERKELKEDSFNQWITYIMISNSDTRKYGSLMNGWITQYSLGNNQYPKTLSKATDVLGQHKFDRTGTNNTSHRRHDKNEKTKNKNQPTTSNEQQNFAQVTTCYCCGIAGHKSPDCPRKDDIPRSEWAIKKMQQQHMQRGDATPSSDGSTLSSMTGRNTMSNRSSSSASHNQNQNREWMGFQSNFHQSNGELLKDTILLDTGSTTSLFANPQLVHNIHDSNEVMELATNAGVTQNHLQAEVPGFGNVWYDPNAIANIFGLSDLKKSCHITYDSEKGDAFVVKKEGTTVEFKCNAAGLYTFTPPKSYCDNVNTKNEAHAPILREKSHVQTIAENRKGYTQRQFERAKIARELYHNVGAPTLVNFKALLRQNIIQNCPVTVDDVNIAEKIFGPDVSTLKGRSTRHKPNPVINDIIEIPAELLSKHNNIELCLDTMQISGQLFLATIDRSIKFRSVIPISSKDHADYYTAIDRVFRYYNAAGFTIKKILCDREFAPMMTGIKDELDIVMNYTNAKDHEPEAERNIRVIKERFRIGFHRLPYSKIPAIMIRHMAMATADRLNLFPVKGGISSYYSPRMILSHTNLDYKKHCTIPFGSYVQMNHESVPTNSQEPRTLDGIYLIPETNDQGGHFIMDLQTGMRVSRATVTVIPITPTVIARVEAMAAKQHIHSLVFKNRNNIILNDTDWLAGVDYENDNDPENAEQNEDNEDNNNNDDAEQNEDNEDNNNNDDADDNDDDDVNNDMLLVNPTNENDNNNATDYNYNQTDTDTNNEILEELIWDDRSEPNSTTNEEEKEEENENVDDDGNESEYADDNEMSVHSHQNSIVETVDDVDNVDEEIEDANNENSNSIRRSGRERREPERLEPTMKGVSYHQRVTKITFADQQEDRRQQKEQCFNIVMQSTEKARNIRYNPDLAMVIARTMKELNDKAKINHSSFAQQYFLKQGLKKFGDRGYDATKKELDQLIQRNCFTPIAVNELSKAERRKAQIALLLLCEKKSSLVKGRVVYNGKPTREWLSREDSASPTAALESIFLTGTIDAKEQRDIMSADIPNAFIQAPMPIEEGKDRVIMKITGVLVQLLIELDTEQYSPFVVMEKGQKVLYVVVLKAIYGMLQAALLWYHQFKDDLEDEGFIFNPYDPCVANKMEMGTQHTIRFHVDDVLSSHVNPKANDKFLQWLNKKYGNHGQVTATRGSVHEYLGMTLDFSSKEKMKVRMEDYVQGMLDSFQIKLKSSETAMTPSSESLLNHGEAKLLDKPRQEHFHTMVAKGLFLCKRARPDIHPTIAVLCTRVRNPNESDWNKLIRLMKYLNGTKKKFLTLNATNLNVIKWYVDASYAVHPDFRSHTGGVMTLGSGAIQSISRKQKLNTKSSTEAELVGADDASIMILWTKLFMEEQGYGIDRNILYQDNKSTILLEVNGRRSAGKRSRALNVRYFFLTDQIGKGNLSVEYCPTDDMIGDFMTKPLQGMKFRKFRTMILGE